MHRFIWAVALAVTLSAQPLAGSEALSVNGTAAPGAPVTLTLLATVSQDLPTIIVSRHVVTADQNGTYQARIPIAPAYERGTLLQLFATSGGQTSQVMRFVVGAPNNGVTVPLEQEGNSL